jgi:hypothetical protein
LKERLLDQSDGRACITKMSRRNDILLCLACVSNFSVNVRVTAGEIDVRNWRSLWYSNKVSSGAPQYFLLAE